jgi:hypothetical protein
MLDMFEIVLEGVIISHYYMDKYDLADLIIEFDDTIDKLEQRKLILHGMIKYGYRFINRIIYC